MSVVAFGSLVLVLEGVVFHMLQEPDSASRIISRVLDNPTNDKLTQLREYLTMTIKLWGGHIAGPVISLIAIVSVITAAFVRNNPSRAAMIVVGTAWLTSAAAIFLMFVAQYDAWKKINQSLAIEKSKNEAAPHMVYYCSKCSFIWAFGRRTDRPLFSCSFGLGRAKPSLYTRLHASDF